MDRSRYRRSQRSALVFILCSILFDGCVQNETVWETDRARFEINDAGYLTHITIRSDSSQPVSNNLLRVPAPLLTLVRGDHHFFPVAARRSGSSLNLVYDGGFEAEIKVWTQKTHLAFELVELTSADSFDVAIWGPFPTHLDDVIGETVGVVREGDYAVGIQALNPKTLGGYPWNDNDTMPTVRVRTMQPTAANDSLLVYRIEAASPDSAGSSLQAYTRNRSRPRLIKNRGYDPMLALPFEDGGLVGSSIALFAVPRSEALETIGKIEVAEGLPHPMLNGEWVKTSRAARESYLIMRYGENTIDKALEIARLSGLRYIYHEAPFVSWGKFILNPGDFPRGAESLRSVVERAESEGVMLGLHTLANFITPNDPLVSPIPDPRLSAIGSTRLVKAISEREVNIIIDDPTYFNQKRRSHLKAARMGEELINYDGVSESPPWQLLNVRRGAFRTRANSHPSGTPIYKLDDHVYRVFLGNAELSIEMARRLGELYKFTGVRQIGFDGHDGTRSSGLGVYGEILFAKAWYDAAGKDIQNNNINSGSRTSHYYWHIYTRMNWGEPWNHSFRVSQIGRRLRSQDYYARNYMPPMLGWFEMRPESSIEDVEWMLSLAAGFDAGFSFVTSADTINVHGKSFELFDRIRIWEKARMAQAFPDSVRGDMRNTEKEFTLEENGEDSWILFPMDRQDFADLQGRIETPIGKSFSSMTIQADSSGGRITVIELGASRFDCDVLLGPMEVVRVERGHPIRHYSSSWHVINEFPVDWEGFSDDIEPATFRIVSPAENDFSIIVRFTGAGIVLHAGS